MRNTERSRTTAPRAHRSFDEYFVKLHRPSAPHESFGDDDAEYTNAAAVTAHIAVTAVFAKPGDSDITTSPAASVRIEHRSITSRER